MNTLTVTVVIELDGDDPHGEQAHSILTDQRLWDGSSLFVGDAEFAVQSIEADTTPA